MYILYLYLIFICQTTFQFLMKCTLNMAIKLYYYYFMKRRCGKKMHYIQAANSNNVIALPWLPDRFPPRSSPHWTTATLPQRREVSRNRPMLTQLLRASHLCGRSIADIWSKWSPQFPLLLFVMCVIDICPISTCKKEQRVSWANKGVSEQTL